MEKLRTALANSESLKKRICIFSIFGFLSYFPSLFGKFVYDDKHLFLENTFTHSLTNIPRYFFPKDQDTFYYRPLAMGIESLLFILGGGSLFLIRLVRISFHIGNAILLFHIYSHFFKKEIALVLSLIFLLHPINSEAVIMTSQEVFGSFLGFSALFLFIRTNTITLRKGTAIFALLLSSILVKETGLLVFAIILTYSLIFQKMIRGAILIGILTGAFYIGIRSLRLFESIYEISFGTARVAQLTFLERLTMIPDIILYYFKTLLFPLNLSIEQQWIRESVDGSFFVSVFVLAGIVVSFLLIYKKLSSDQLKKVFLFFSLFFVLGILPYLQIVPLSMTVADRWFYIPLVGLLGLLGVVLELLFKEKRKVYGIILATLFILIPFYICVTFFRSIQWQTELRLYKHDLSVDQNNYVLQSNYATALITEGEYSKALMHYQKAHELFPHHLYAYNIGITYQKLGEYEKALTFFSEAKTDELPETNERIVEIFIFQDRLLEAREYLDSLFSQGNLSEHLFLLSAVVHQRLNNPLYAQNDIQNAINMNPSPENIHFQNMILRGEMIQLK